jgi:putative chitinase
MATSLNVAALQSRLKLTPDGVAGPKTFTAIFAKFGANATIAPKLGASAAVNFLKFDITDTALRLVHFVGQTAHESGNYRYMQELGGPSYFARYDGRKDLGNVKAGDGAAYHGRGIIQLTGRANYRAYGLALGIDLEGDPDQVADPAIGLLVACHYWKSHGLNELADADDITRITRKINGGVNGLADRKNQTLRAKVLIL